MPFASTAIFDLDGTLTDSKPGILSCLTRTLEAHGISWTGPLDWFIGPPAGSSFARLMPNSNDAHRSEVLRDYRACYADTGWAGNSVYPGIPELLSSMRAADFQLFVCTSKRQGFAHTILEHFKLEQYFSGLYADRGESENHSKSDLLARLLVEQRVDPLTCSMIGDRSFDIEAAQAHRIRSIAVTYGYGSDEELAAARPDLLCHSPEEIGKALLGSREPVA